MPQLATSLLASGLYLVGDPRLLLPFAIYDRMAKESGQFGEGTDLISPRGGGVFYYEGTSYAVLGTPYGAGNYATNRGVILRCPTGKVACIPTSFTIPLQIPNALSFSAASRFEVGYEEGILTFGPVKIYANDDAMEKG